MVSPCIVCKSLRPFVLKYRLVCKGRSCKKGRGEVEECSGIETNLSWASRESASDAALRNISAARKRALACLTCISGGETSGIEEVDVYWSHLILNM